MSSVWPSRLRSGAHAEAPMCVSSFQTITCTGRGRGLCGSGCGGWAAGGGRGVEGVVRWCGGSGGRGGWGTCARRCKGETPVAGVGEDAAGAPLTPHLQR
eukprot:scaffold4195_cov92-Isochrysis_galbana.AAC.8